jgi:hypothetical protein
MKLPNPVTCLIASVLLVAALPAAANTSSVFSPSVSEGDRSLEYRASYVPSEGDRPYVFGHRLHYQHALNGSTRWRIIGFQGGPDSDLDFRYVRGELQYQFTEAATAGWDNAVRFELQIGTKGGVSDRFRIGWTGKVDVGRWQFRANALADGEFGANNDSGIGLETRLQTTYGASDRFRFGVEMFSDFNTTADIGDFNEQEHQLGPIFKARFTKALRAEFSYLFRLSDEAPIDNARLQVRYAL